MALALTYELTYAGVPFLSDDARALRWSQEDSSDSPRVSPRKHQPERDLVEEVDRLFPFDWMTEFGYDLEPSGRDVDALSHVTGQQRRPGPEVRIGEYYYPTTACRWSYFRGLATSSCVKEMVRLSLGGSTRKTFKMRSTPQIQGGARTYGIETDLYMLPPRPLGETVGNLDGLYLVTLVDERYRWQFMSVSLTPRAHSTWDEFVSTVASALGVTVTYSAFDPAHGRPEPDSQLWCNNERASLILDALAGTLGRTVVRNYDGTYKLYLPSESRALALNSRKTSSGNVIRRMGGDSINSGTSLPAGSLSKAREAVVPSAITVTYPKYVTGEDPIPHYLNPRGQATRHYEDGYGSTFSVSVPITSGGSLVSGLSGGPTHVIQSTAKALYETEALAFSTSPYNNSGLTALALELADDYWTGLVATGLDETYLGIVRWTPDGLHDLVFRYSPLGRDSSTRAMHTEWNSVVKESTHGTPALSGRSINVVGQGGPPPPLTVRSIGGAAGPVGVVASGLLISGTILGIASGHTAPVDRRWKAQIDQEIMLVEGSSGGNDLGIAARGIDGTLNAAHTSGATITGLIPGQNYLTNLLSFEDPLAAYPGAFTSGGVQEVRIAIRSGVAISGGAVASGPSLASGDTNNWYSFNNFYNLTQFYNANFFNLTTYNYAWVILSGSYSGYPLSGYPKLRVDARSGTQIHGFLSGSSGQILYLWNAGTMPFTLMDKSQSAPSGTRIWVPLSGSDYTLWPDDGCILQYDGFSGIDGRGRWRFDVPTIGGGNTVGGGGVQGIRTYALRDLRAGSGITYVNGGMGQGVLMVARAESGGPLFSGDPIVVSGSTVTDPYSGVTGARVANSFSYPIGTPGPGVSGARMYFDEVRYDINNFRVSGDTSLLRAPAPGIYRVGATVTVKVSGWTPESGTFGWALTLRVTDNDTRIGRDARTFGGPSLGLSSMTLSTEYEFVSGTGVYMEVTTNYALNPLLVMTGEGADDGNHTPEFHMSWVGPRSGGPPRLV